MSPGGFELLLVRLRSIMQAGQEFGSDVGTIMYWQFQRCLEQVLSLTGHRSNIGANTSRTAGDGRRLSWDIVDTSGPVVRHVVG
ncbi:hypothetical protein EF847_15215 [Actinobacteria bacterium YIM 96077]|uniref:Uncharacterized protein n=1 Tax=Phytoactinopolyspora halophila TaxID=1981511 RepID=A0A329QVD2_9ACTN|nr:hypothetical protein EF847_15215 [Actinobacteria bacterium YIM 96077]RAW15609.1 hypothetical protein DPM12_08125 [Phytoactinopolyspora halophila]